MMLKCHILFVSLKRQNTHKECNTIKTVKNMKVKIFDCEHEKDLESAVNLFLNSGNYDIIDIKYCVSTSIFSEEQIYCYSAMVIYNES